MPITYSHVIGKSENRTLPKKKKINTKHIFMNEMEHFERSDRFELHMYELLVSKMESMHACITCHCLENIAPEYHHQLFTISFHKSPWFHFLVGAFKNVLSRRFSPFWARIGRVTGTKQLFCQGLSKYIACIIQNFLFYLFLLILCKIVSPFT